MKVNLFIFLICIYFININVVQGQKQNNTYVNDEYNYSIQFPENWIIESRKEIMYHVISCQTPDTGKVKQGSIKIMIQDAKGEENIEMVADKMTKPIKEFIAKDFVENKNGKITINGIDFYLYDYSYNYKRSDLPERQRNFNCYLIKEDKLIMLMFWGNESYFEKNLEMIMKSLESFKFIQ